MASIAMVVSNRYDPDPRVHKEATTLAEAGHEGVVYAFDRMHELEPTLEPRPRLRIERVRVRPTKVGDLIATALGVRAFVNEVKRGVASAPVDVVHCHDQDTCPVGLWWKRAGARRLGRPGRFVFDAHDLYWIWLTLPNPRSHLRRTGAWLLRRRDRFFAQAADLLVTVTEGQGDLPGLAEIYRAWDVHPVVVWNAPRRPASSPRRLPDCFTVGYLGSLREPAVFQWLVDAIGGLDHPNRVCIRVAGSGRSQSEVRALLEQGARDVGFGLKLSGSFSLAELPELMADTTLQYCLYPADRGNIERAMPVKLLDSVAHGRPVIGNANTLMADWIERNGWGWIAPQANPGALAEVLAEALDQLAPRTSFDGSSTKRPALTSPPFWEQPGERLVAAYEQLLKP